MGDVMPLPIVLRRRAAPVRVVSDPLERTGGKRGEYAIGDIARALKLTDKPRTVIDKLRALARHDGMPLPITPRLERGRPIHGPRSIYARSRWDAGEIDAWLDGRGPAAPAQPVARPIRDEMRARAASGFGAVAAVA
ncbi:hypothetical protein M9978_08200 [Sphingomonas sp. MG17]|uniref:Uncharacterized protein n=1 Tax=Sphingomonas tagetis TaxID=2949092 RepID=A0A9X2KP93_9SPHN|nr:hypothetical protein [Sphingomonas tagetis]MCP3730408.1 hypothetical protein [Sphingomonas tagetis]